MNAFDIMFVSLVCVGILGVIIHGIWYQMTHSPRSWKHDGPVATNVNVALGVIHEMLPTPPKRWGGIVHWTGTPIEYVDYDGSKHSAGGMVLNTTVPEIRVQFFENVWETALAHELIHVFTGWADGDPRLQPLVQNMNEAIKQRLAAVV